MPQVFEMSVWVVDTFVKYFSWPCLHNLCHRTLLQISEITLFLTYHVASTAHLRLIFSCCWTICLVFALYPHMTKVYIARIIDLISVILCKSSPVFLPLPLAAMAFHLVSWCCFFIDTFSSIITLIICLLFSIVRMNNDILFCLMYSIVLDELCFALVFVDCYFRSRTTWLVYLRVYSILMPVIWPGMLELCHQRIVPPSFCLGESSTSECSRSIYRV